MKTGVKYALTVCGMVVSWSVFYAVSKLVVGATGSPLLGGLLLRAAALVFLTAQLLADGSFRRLFSQRGRTLAVLLLIGMFGFLLDLFANLGYLHGSLSTGTALLKTDVLMVNLATVIVYKKKLYASDWLGSAIMLAGVLLVLGVDFGGMELRVTDLFFLLSAACVSANAFIIKAAQEKYGADSDMISYYNNLTVLALFAACSAATGSFRAEAFGAIARFWPLVALGGLAQTGIYFFYYRCLRHCEVWLVKLYLLLMPVLSCFIGVVFLNEELTAKKLLGVGVVLLGAAIILLRGRINRAAGGAK
ncbi:MAG: DMT family transporter [Oscillospiraceae bacterium]|nr:DMT family transporter [Oscillospiraceae bacterium]